MTAELSPDDARQTPRAADPLVPEEGGPAAGSRSGVPDLLPARMVNEYVYCPRLAYLEWVQGEWEDSEDTIDGKTVHRRVDEERETDFPAGDDDDPGRPVAARSILLSDPDLGAIARIDLVEAEGRVATPIDYKRGRAPEVAAGAWDPERVQVCLQGLILRANGYQADRGVIWFAGSRQRVEVLFDDELVALTRASVAGLRALGASGRLPPPLVDSPKCVGCSLAGICLPDEVNALRGVGAPEDARRLVPARDERRSLYVQEQGTTIAKRGERLVVTTREQGVAPTEVRLLDVAHVAVFGAVQVTTQALRALAEQDVPVAFLSYGGWLWGVLHGTAHKNVEGRMAQHRLADAGATLPIARQMVCGKLLNQRTFLRRNLPEPDKRLLGRLALHAHRARHAKDSAELLGLEGLGAREYFTALPGLLRGSGAWAAARFRELGRNRRPPGDEVNAVLSFLYTLLVKDAYLAAVAVGLDPLRGVYHVPKYGRPALALDLAEEFRPLVADSTCITLFNQGELGASDFLRRARGVQLTAAGRKTVIAGYERRMTTLVTHPLFGYSLSYRRVLELQARLLRAVLLGDAPAYRAFTTR